MNFYHWAFAALTASAALGADKLNYERDVQPLLQAKCFECHGPEKQLSGLRLDRRQLALRGGDYGKVIVVGDSKASKLVERLEGSKGGLQMPPSGALEPNEIATIRAWIDQGPDYGNSQQLAPRVEKRATSPALAALIDAIVAGKKIAPSPELAKESDSSGSTALMHAASRGSIGSMRALLAAGAPVNAANRRGANALIWALGDPARVKLLLEAGADARMKTVENRTPLHVAAQQSAILETIRLLLAAGADPNAPDLAGATPLHVAATAGSAPLAAMLLDAGAKVDAPSGNGSTALIMAATAGDDECVRLLLSKGASAKAVTKRNVSALGGAAYWGNVKTIAMLIEKGAPVQLHEADGYSPLMYAAYSESAGADAVALLLRHGADPQSGGGDETPASLAKLRGATDVLELLRKASEKKIGATR